MWCEGLFALPADELLIERVAAGVVHEHGRRIAAGQIPVTPAHQRNQRRRQRHAHLGEPILVSRRALAVELTGEHAVFDQPPESVGQHRFGDVEVLLEVVEPAGATKRLTQDQHRPSVAEHIEAGLDRTTVGSRVRGRARRRDRR